MIERTIKEAKRRAKKLHRALKPDSPGLQRCQHLTAVNLGFRSWAAFLEAPVEDRRRALWGDE